MRHKCNVFHSNDRSHRRQSSAAELPSECNDLLAVLLLSIDENRDGCILLILSSAPSKYFFSISIPINFLSISIEATPEEPTPIKGSNTTSPLFVAILTKCFNNLIGFCVGCFGFFNLSGPIHDTPVKTHATNFGYASA